MIWAGGGGISTQRDLLGSPGWQEKLKHYLLNHVRVETNICLPSVSPSDPLEFHACPPAPTMTSPSSLLIRLTASCLSLLLQDQDGKGREGFLVGEGQPHAAHSRHAAMELLLSPCTWPWELLLLYEASFIVSEVQRGPQTDLLEASAPSSSPGYILTDGVNLGKPCPSSRSQFPY